MAIKATFLSGRNDTTTENLYQWDYGQVLEIEFSALGSLLCEVHFACHGMTEAIVRPCTLSAGIGSVTIPDDCLEQSAAITAWIYEKGANSANGRTRGVITIPVVSRTRPGIVRDIPPETNDQYTLLIQEVNDAIDDIENGKVKAKYAGEADTAKSATYATSAGNADTAGNANYATTAGTASSATNATSAGFATNAGNATNDANGRPLVNSLMSTRDGFKQYGGVLIGGGVLSCRIGDSTDARIIVEVSGQKCHSGVVMVTYDGNQITARLGFEKQGDSELYKITFQEYDTITKSWLTRNAESAGIPVYFKHLVAYQW